MEFSPSLKTLQAPDQAALGFTAWTPQAEQTCSTVGTFLPSWLHWCVLVELAVACPWGDITSMTVPEGSSSEVPG